VCLLRGTKLIFIRNSLHVSFESENAAAFQTFLSCNIRLSTQNTILFLGIQNSVVFFLINQLAESKYFHLGLLRCKY